MVASGVDFQFTKKKKNREKTNLPTTNLPMRGDAADLAYQAVVMFVKFLSDGSLMHEIRHGGYGWREKTGTIKGGQGRRLGNRPIQLQSQPTLPQAMARSVVSSYLGRGGEQTTSPISELRARLLMSQKNHREPSATIWRGSHAFRMA